MTQRGAVFVHGSQTRGADLPPLRATFANPTTVVIGSIDAICVASRCTHVLAEKKRSTLCWSAKLQMRDTALTSPAIQNGGQSSAHLVAAHRGALSAPLLAPTAFAIHSATMRVANAAQPQIFAIAHTEAAHVAAVGLHGCGAACSKC